ncbi:hypothetical protein Tco_1200290 [Tanacetum coccineum]
MWGARTEEQAAPPPVVKAEPKEKVAPVRPTKEAKATEKGEIIHSLVWQRIAFVAMAGASSVLDSVENLAAGMRASHAVGRLSGRYGFGTDRTKQKEMTISQTHASEPMAEENTQVATCEIEIADLDKRAEKVDFRRPEVAQLPEINMLKGSTQRLSEIHRNGVQDLLAFGSWLLGTLEASLNLLLLLGNG